MVKPLEQVLADMLCQAYDSVEITDPRVRPMREAKHLAASKALIEELWPVLCQWAASEMVRTGVPPIDVDDAKVRLDAPMMWRHGLAVCAFCGAAAPCRKHQPTSSAKKER